MFYHAYEAYMVLAFPKDDIRPISGSGHNSYGGLSVTLIDSLDTLAVMGDKEEFNKAVNLVKDISLHNDVNISVFETNIRVIGGLISAHLLQHEMNPNNLPNGWPCKGPLLEKAQQVADILLKSFDSPSGIPYGSINLRNGVPNYSVESTCIACAGTFILEFAALSRLLGDDKYEKAALKSFRKLWEARSDLNLFPRYINITNGNATTEESSVGAESDSFFEYLLKGAVLTGSKELNDMFTTALDAINKLIRNNELWHAYVSLRTGNILKHHFSSLEAFWPGLLALHGDIDAAVNMFKAHFELWKKFGFLPDAYDFKQNTLLSSELAYPLRPEFAESALYLFQATNNPFYLDVGKQIISSIKHSAKTFFGYAHIHRVTDHAVDDLMESFFLAETTKYLYLLFDPNNFIFNSQSMTTIQGTMGKKCLINSGFYIFTTEGHYIDAGVLECCSSVFNSDSQYRPSNKAFCNYSIYDQFYM